MSPKSKSDLCLQFTLKKKMHKNSTMIGSREKLAVSRGRATEGISCVPLTVVSELHLRAASPSCPRGK